jgi:hypothetical protein
VIDHEILSKIICTVPLLWHVQKLLAVSCESKTYLVLVNCLTACPGKVQWLNCALVNSKRLFDVVLRVGKQIYIDDNPSHI